MTVNFYEQLKNLENESLIAPNLSTRIYVGLARELRSPYSFDMPHLVEQVAPTDSRHFGLPKAGWKSLGKLEITPEGLDFVEQQINQGGLFRNIGPESTAAIQLALEVLRG